MDLADDHSVFYCSRMSDKIAVGRRVLVITNSSIGMESARTYTSAYTDVKQFKSIMVKQTSMVNADESDALSTIKSKCLNYLLKWLFGMDDDDLKNYSWNRSGSSDQVGFMKVTYEHVTTFSECETTDFSTSGKITCADGREIDFNLDVSMSRSFMSQASEMLTVAQALDPLVINLDTNIADVSDQKFFFDLDCDGTKDEISRLGAGSGFLALDLNEDGVINDGSELFGTKSGNGFEDLSAYDSDHNGWIDEADDIFSKLTVCCIDENGNQELYSLKEKGVGAICLKNAPTQFSLNNAETNVTNAYIRRTGLFLYENGTAGSLQQVDMAM